MGERGVVSRILAPKFGSYLTFGALSAEKASAPGQPLLSELKHLYGLPQQSAATKVSPSRSAFESDSEVSRADRTLLSCALRRCSCLIGHNWMCARPPCTSCELMLQEAKSCAVQVYGVIGNPVSHSRSPALHNTGMRAVGMDAVYVPLLVDDLQPFLHAFPDFSGFSVTIPHKVQHAGRLGLAS